MFSSFNQKKQAGLDGKILSLINENLVLIYLLIKVYFLIKVSLVAVLVLDLFCFETYEMKKNLTFDVQYSSLRSKGRPKIR